MYKTALSIVIIALLNLTSFAQKKIIFQVDINGIEELSDSEFIIGLRGNVAPLTWFRNIEMKDDDNDGIFEAAVNFDKDADLYFKYVINNKEWETGDAQLLKLSETGTDYTIRSSFRYQAPGANPFEKFIGKWTLKDDQWVQGNSPDSYDTIYLPNQFTVCEELNTHKSLLWTVESTSGTGHGFWTYNEHTNQLNAQTSFFENRVGLGSGSINENGDLFINMQFEGSELEGTYRKYSYEWLDANSYLLKSYQYDQNNQPTGNFYGGVFIRIEQD